MDVEFFFNCYLHIAFSHFLITGPAGNRSNEIKLIGILNNLQFHQQKKKNTITDYILKLKNIPLSYEKLNKIRI